MKSLDLFSIIILVGVTVTLTNINAQEKSTGKGTYKFEFKHESKQDSLPTLYCMMRVADLQDYNRVSISYNDKTKEFTIGKLLKEKSNDYKVEGDFIYFKIDEKLIEPFVVIEGKDRDGKRYNIRERNANGEVTDPIEEKAKWGKAIKHTDSLDHIR
jgi:hypothetical protein